MRKLSSHITVCVCVCVCEICVCIILSELQIAGLSIYNMIRYLHNLPIIIHGSCSWVSKILFIYAYPLRFLSRNPTMASELLV